MSESCREAPRSGFTFQNLVPEKLRAHARPEASSVKPHLAQKTGEGTLLKRQGTSPIRQANSLLRQGTSLIKQGTSLIRQGDVGLQVLCREDALPGAGLQTQMARCRAWSDSNYDPTSMCRFS